MMESWRIKDRRRKKPSAWQGSNPLPHDYKVSAPPLRNNCSKFVNSIGLQLCIVTVTLVPVVFGVVDNAVAQVGDE